jgi:hypothetical protein
MMGLDIRKDVVQKPPRQTTLAARLDAAATCQPSILLQIAEQHFWLLQILQQACRGPLSSDLSSSLPLYFAKVRITHCQRHWRMPNPALQESIPAKRLGRFHTHYFPSIPRRAVTSQNEACAALGNVPERTTHVG